MNKMENTYKINLDFLKQDNKKLKDKIEAIEISKEKELSELIIKKQNTENNLRNEINELNKKAKLKNDEI